MGAGAQGKSYTIAAWAYLDWFRDPTQTCCKVLSVNLEHAKRNVFAHIQNFHRQASIKPPAKVTATSIQMGDDDKQGIHLMTIPIGESGAGRLRGFHPVPRSEEHPAFGRLSRIRVILDEAEEIGEGVWEDVDNILSTISDTEHVRIVAATNPKDRNSKFGIRCEPIGGWSKFDVESSEYWRSNLGWNVLRIDGAKTENVMTRQEQFPGLLTWGGYQRYISLGENAPTYWTMARGAFPEIGTFDRIFPPMILDKMRGSLDFIGPTSTVAGCDLAMEGGDQALMTIGRFGMARGWSLHSDGKMMLFQKPKVCLQIDSQIPLSKLDSVAQADQIAKLCKDLSIQPHCLAVDRTGLGTGVHDLLCHLLGRGVHGVNYGSSPTSMPITLESVEKPGDLYDGIVTELFFAARTLAEHDFVKCFSSCFTQSFMRELGDRRYKQVSKVKVRIESKKEYKNRGNPSPDFADSFCLCVHAFRCNLEGTATILPENSETKELRPSKVAGIVDALDYISFED